MLKITLTASDLRTIKDLAGQTYLRSAVPRELDSSEFLVYCYTKAVESVLCTKGAALDVNLDTKLPYEPVE